MGKLPGNYASFVLLFASLLGINNAFAGPSRPIELLTYLDGSYNYLVHSNQFISGVPDRTFDLQENGFTLQQAAINVGYQPEVGFGGLINLVVGRDPLTLAPFGYDPHLGPSEMGIVIPQAFVQYRQANMSFTLGEYATLAGVESFQPTEDQQFSRSLLFTFAAPKLHLGLRGLLSANEDLAFIFGLNNGWDNIRDFSRDKTFECGFQYHLPWQSLIALMLYSGEERIQPNTASGPSGRRNLVDLVAKTQVGDRLSLAANIDYGVQNNALLDNGGRGKAIWLGIAGYAQYQLNNEWSLAFRAEDFNDKDGYRTGVLQNLKEMTFTVGFAPTPNLQLRAEIREDWSSDNAFSDKNKIGQSDFQQSVALEVLYQFNYG